MAGSKPGRKLPPRREDLTGHRFGRFTVVRFADVRGGSARWACQCDCGAERLVFAHCLKGGSSTSCGCKLSRPHGKEIELSFFKESELERFIEYVQSQDQNGCCRWLGPYYPNGYGRFWAGRRSLRANRVSYVVATGKTLRPEQFICHTCDNPWCVAPKHLYLGDAATNARDREARGRGNSRRKAASELGL